MDYYNFSNGNSGDITSVITTITAVSTAIFLILGYRKSNRTKAAEIYHNLEASFREHIPILLDIEYDSGYINKIADAIIAVEEKRSNKKQDKVVVKLDRMLRHFHTCYQIKELNIDSKKLDNGYHYYLKFFLQPNREVLTNYIKEYWISVYNWAEEDVHGNLGLFKKMRRFSVSFVVYY
jgi:hypothetical protein